MNDSLIHESAYFGCCDFLVRSIADDPYGIIFVLWPLLKSGYHSLVA